MPSPERALLANHDSPTTAAPRGELFEQEDSVDIDLTSPIGTHRNTFASEPPKNIFDDL